MNRRVVVLMVAVATSAAHAETPPPPLPPFPLTSEAPGVSAVVRPLTAPAGPRETAAPGTSPVRFIGQTLLGLLGTGLGFAAAVPVLFDQNPSDQEAGLIFTMFTGAGAAAGVALGGFGDGRTSGGLGALAGGMLGTLAGLGILMAGDVDDGGTAMMIVALPTVGALTGYYATSSRTEPVAPRPIAAPSRLSTNTNTVIVPFASVAF